MNNIKMSLIDNDYAVQCQAELKLSKDERTVLNKFLKEISAELSIGQTAFLEIEGSQIEPITVSVSNGI